MLIGALVSAPLATGADGPPAGVSGEAWVGIQGQLETEQHRVGEPDRPGRLYRAENPTQRFTAHFGSKDVLLVPRGQGEEAWQLGLRLTAWGAADDLQPVHPAGAFAENNRVEYRRGPLTEWYVNRAKGLEQGFIIDAPPTDDITELVLEMTLDGDLTPVLAGDGIRFQRDGATTALTYSGLAAWDAVNAPLDARMELAGGGTRLRLVISVTDAAWPLTVDPIFAQMAKLLPTPDLDSWYANFGWAVAVDVDLMVVGFLDTEHGERSGAAHIFRRDQGGAGSWTHVAKIIALDGAPHDEFGLSVAISDDTVVVGARGDDDSGEDSGSVYIFRRDQGGPDAWGQVAKITDDDGDALDRFGGSVSISGETVVVGATGDDDNGESSGAAYVFRNDHGGPDAWGQVAKLTAAGGEITDVFGSSVAISGDTAVIGADPAYINFNDIGFACVFRRDQGGPDAWGQVARITADDAVAGDRFGKTVSMSGDTVVVGSEKATINGFDRGAAYVFRRDQGGPDAWGQVAKMTADDGSSDDRFGGAVAIAGDTAIVGARQDFDNGIFSGSAYVFERDLGGPDAWGQVTKITPADGGEGDYFGRSVAVTGDTAVVGAPGQDGAFESSGSVYLFGRDEGGADTWGQKEKVPCPPVFAAHEELFGKSVAIDADTVIVGASWDDDNGPRSGSALIFRRDQGGPDAWGLVTKLLASDGATLDNFGHSVSASGDMAIIGAYGDDDNGTDSGSAYLFRRDQGGPDGWGFVAKISADDGQEEDRFGTSVDISGDTVFVAAALDDNNGVDSGSVYIFGRDQGGPDAWGQIARITASDGSADDLFGAVSISGNTAIVGTGLDDDNGSNSGSAYIFGRDHGGPDAWGQLAKITPTDGSAGDYFGSSVTISGDTVVVGAYGDDDNGSSSGSAYVFRRDHGEPGAWGQVAKITVADGDIQDYFGYSVTVANDLAVVGAHGDDGVGSWTGSAYVFRRDRGGPDAWGQVAKITAADAGFGDEFGYSVDVDDGTAIVGAPESDSLGDESGAAYVFALFDDTLLIDGFETGDTSAWSATVP